MTHFSVRNAYLCLQVFSEDSGELRTSFGNCIHYTHWKLNCAYLRCDSIRTYELEVERSEACDAIADEEAIFIKTDLKK